MLNISNKEHNLLAKKDADIKDINLLEVMHKQLVNVKN